MEPDELEGPDQISRRRMLRNIGVGTAVVWTAPTVLSLGGRAMAQVASPVCEPGNCPACPANACADFCFCFPTPGGGDCVCVAPRPCSEAGPCETDGDCPGNERCVQTCCGVLTCGLPCAEGAGAAATGPGTQAG